jgi:hypothetical protein
MSQFGPAILLALMGSAVFGQPLNSSNGDLALVGGTIYASPTEEPIRDGVVLIHDGKIAALGSRESLKVPRAVESLDCSGLTPYSTHCVPGRSSIGQASDIFLGAAVQIASCSSVIVVAEDNAAYNL